MDGYNQRAYSRGQHFAYDGTVSVDGETWEKADISDLSSGGLKLVTKANHTQGDELWFDLVIYGFMSEFQVKVPGKICRKTDVAGKYQYGIEFIGLSQDTKIRIDANVHNDRPVEKKEYKRE